MREVQLALSPRQLGILRKGGAVHLKHGQIGNGMGIHVSAPIYNRLQKWHAKGKGMKMRLDKTSMDYNMRHGGGLYTGGHGLYVGNPRGGDLFTPDPPRIPRARPLPRRPQPEHETESKHEDELSEGESERRIEHSGGHRKKKPKSLSKWQRFKNFAWQNKEALAALAGAAGTYALHRGRRYGDEPRFPAHNPHAAKFTALHDGRRSRPGASRFGNRFITPSRSGPVDELD